MMHLCKHYMAASCRSLHDQCSDLEEFEQYLRRSISQEEVHILAYHFLALQLHSLFHPRPPTCAEMMYTFVTAFFNSTIPFRRGPKMIAFVSVGFEVINYSPASYGARL